MQFRKATAAAEEREESRVVSDGLVTTESPRKGALVQDILQAEKKLKGWTAKLLSMRRMAERKRNRGIGGNLSQNSFLTGTKEMVAMGLCQTKKEMAREDSWVLFGESLVGKHKRTKSGNGALANETRRLLSHPRQSYLPQRQEPNLLQIHLTPCPLSITSSQLSL